MSTTLNPTYFSKSAEANKYTMCTCGRRVKKDEIRMKKGKKVCSNCK